MVCPLPARIGEWKPCHEDKAHHSEHYRRGYFRPVPIHPLAHLDLHGSTNFALPQARFKRLKILSIRRWQSVGGGLRVAVQAG